MDRGWWLPVGLSSEVSDGLLKSVALRYFSAVNARKPDRSGCESPSGRAKRRCFGGARIDRSLRWTRCRCQLAPSQRSTLRWRFTLKQQQADKSSEVGRANPLAPRRGSTPDGAVGPPGTPAHARRRWPVSHACASMMASMLRITARRLRPAEGLVRLAGLDPAIGIQEPGGSVTGQDSCLRPAIPADIQRRSS